MSKLRLNVPASPQVDIPDKATDLFFVRIKMLWRYAVVLLCILVLSLLTILPSEAIYKGDIVETGMYPWFVRLPSSSCGGTLIAPDWVLTARHCVTFSTVGQEVEVRGFGENPIKATVKRVIRHSEGNQAITSVQADVAIIQLETPILDIPPAVLVKPYEVEPAQSERSKLRILGQGLTDYPYIFNEDGDGYVRGQKMRSAGITRISGILEWSNTGLLARPLDPEIEDRFSGPGGPCDEDSGGGAFFTVNGEARIVAVQSSLSNCNTMAYIDLYRNDGDGNDMTLTLPNGSVLQYSEDVPITNGGYSSENDLNYSITENTTYGGTSATGLYDDNPIGNTYREFLNCNLPNLDSYERTIELSGYVYLDDDLALDKERQYTYTGIYITNQYGTVICITTPDSDGKYTAYLSDDMEGQSIKVELRTFDVEGEGPSYVSGYARLYRDLIVESSVDIPPVLLTLGTDSNDVPNVLVEQNVPIRPVSVTIIFEEPTPSIPLSITLNEDIAADEDNRIVYGWFALVSILSFVAVWSLHRNVERAH